MRDQAYLASVELARERGAFPLFNADLYLSGGNFASPAAGRGEGQDPQARPAQLPPAVHRPHRHDQPGLRRQRSNGIEPPFSYTYTRKKRMADGTFKERGRGLRLAPVQASGGDVAKLPDYFVTALEISAKAHQDMVAAVAPPTSTPPSPRR
jgi:ribonucleoside-diphosphate reductase alpha chain